MTVAPLLIHPVDAVRAGVENGTMAKVATSEGTATVAAEVTDEVKPGVVSLPHGWGHGLDGTQLTTANRHPGITPTTCSIPPTSSMRRATPMPSTGVPCHVSPA